MSASIFNPSGNFSSQDRRWREMVGQTLLGGRKKKGKKGRQRSPKYALYEYLASYNKQIKEYSRKMSSTPFFSEAQGLDAVP